MRRLPAVTAVLLLAGALVTPPSRAEDLDVTNEGSFLEFSERGRSSPPGDDDTRHDPGRAGFPGRGEAGYGKPAGETPKVGRLRFEIRNPDAARVDPSLPPEEPPLPPGTR